MELLDRHGGRDCSSSLAIPLSVSGRTRKMAKSKNPNPLFAKKPGENASDHMKRLRLEFPLKFRGRPPGSKNKKPKITQADVDAAVDKAVTEALKNPPPPTAPAQGAGIPPQEQIVTDTTILPAPPQPATPNLNPPLAPAVPDTKIFGSETPPPPKLDPHAEPVPPPPPPGNTPGAPGPAPAPEPAQDNLGLATIVWTMLVNLFVGIFGPTWLPTSKEESDMCVGAWKAYFESIGIKPFSPLVNLWLAMFAYVAPRFGSIVAKFRKKKTTLEESPRGSPPDTSAKKEPSPAPAAPAPEKKPAVPPAPPTAMTILDVGDWE